MVEGGAYRFYTCAREFYYNDNFAFATDALLISGNGANVGYIHHYCGKFNAYQRTYVLDQFDDNIMFVYYYLEANLHPRIAAEKKAGNTPYIVLSTLSKMSMWVPASPEQKKIAEFLSLVDERIEQQRQLVEALKRYKRGLFISIYSANYSHWHQAKIRDYSKALGGYAFDSKSYNDDGIYKVITIGNVSGNKYIDTSNTNKVPEIPTDMQPHQILQNGDIVISMTGNVGRVSVVNQLNCLLNQRVAKLDIKDVLVKEYIYQVLSNSDFEQEMNNVGQGAAQKNIKNTDIENYVFYIPQTDQHIETFTTILKKLDENIMHQDMIYFMLKRTKQALLQQMFI